ncbi:MAG: FkbM family methyltransferase [Pseudomonadota bacterium]
MISRRKRHAFLQSIFWNRIGRKIVPKIAKFEVMFDTVVRGYSLIPDSNGEEWLPTLAGENTTMFDVGFYSGSSTTEYLTLYENAKVHAFDPSRFGLQNYEKDFAGDARVTFAPVALSSVPGELEFYDYENMCNSLAQRKEMPGQEPTVYTVEVTTLDAYCAANDVDHIHHLKIDAEGYDLDVLEGARRMLEEQKIDIFMFEFASGWAATKRYLWEAVEYMEPLPYTLCRLYNGFLVPVEYHINQDSCTTRPAMYVGVSNNRMARGDIETRDYNF